TSCPPASRSTRSSPSSSSWSCTRRTDHRRPPASTASVRYVVSPAGGIPHHPLGHGQRWPKVAGRAGTLTGRHIAVARGKENTVLIAQRPTLSEEVISESRSRFSIEPLEPGFGYTLGNSLRRTLLSSIPGASVTSIRVDGVLHEFSTVPGVKEDITEIILNIKDLVV